MRKYVNLVKRTYRKIRKSPFFRARFLYTYAYEKLKLNDKQIFLESYSGNNLSGNVYYLLLELATNEKYSGYELILGVKQNQVEKVTNLLLTKGITNVKVVAVHSKAYVNALASSKYLFNNSTLPTYFIKKSGQIYVNTWHGTPLKTLGRSIISAPYEIGNTQRNFIHADYLLYPNEFTYNQMRKDYMLDNLYTGKYVLSGYPRNQVFLDEAYQTSVREALELTDKEVICYMPTWRGSVDSKNNEEQYINIMYYLLQIDKQLNENQVMYVNLHNFVANKIRFKMFKNIKPFPSDYETYEFLSIADTLITDYSSVFFDYANTKRKIILFTYDLEEYLSERGMYLDIKELPFIFANDVTSLMNAINQDTHPTYDEFVKNYCYYDTPSVTSDVLDLVFNNGKRLKVYDAKAYENNKEQVLIFAGALMKNGLTTSLRGLVNHLDLEKRNYYLLFYKNKVKANSYVINELPAELGYIPMQGQKNLTIGEAIAQALYYRFDMDNKFIEAKLAKLFKREAKRLFSSVHFDDVIHFTGYERNIAQLFTYMDDANRVMYVHNDMNKERKTRGNYHIKSIEKAYHNFNLIAGVRDSMREEIATFLNNDGLDKIRIVHNVNNIEAIINGGNLPIAFNEDTFSTHSVEAIEEILNGTNEVFVNVARYSPEKGLDRLASAFAQYAENKPNSYLIIIGGHGTLFNQILEYVQTNELERIVIIKSLNNPFPIVKRCNAFVLSSHYEGLPMSIMESLILDVPVISTNITGPAQFLAQGYGHLVDDSEAGLIAGFMAYHDGLVQPCHFDAEAFNQQALAEFETLLGK